VQQHNIHGYIHGYPYPRQACLFHFYVNQADNIRLRFGLTSFGWSNATSLQKPRPIRDFALGGVPSDADHQ